MNILVDEQHISKSLVDCMDILKSIGRHQMSGLQIALAFVLGAVAGLIFGDRVAELKAVTDIFLRFLQMVVGVLMFATLVAGIHAAGRHAKARHVTISTIASFCALTAIALCIGMAGSLIFEPGVGLALLQASAPPAPAVSFHWMRLVPSNIVDSLARGDTLQIVVFAVCFGIATLSAGKSGDRVSAGLGDISQVLLTFVQFLVRFTPIVAFCGTAALVGSNGIGALLQYLLLAGIVIAGLAMMAFIVFPLYALAYGVPFRQVWQAARAPVLVGFFTASGAAALPVAMASLSERAQSTGVIGFVVPLAAAFNLTGSTLFAGSATLFLLQASGAELSVLLSVQVFLILFVVSKAIPSVPRGSLALIAMAASGAGASVDQVAAGIGALLAIDALLDMMRTAVNVLGHCTVASAIDYRFGASKMGRIKTLGSGSSD
jgi:proton glutamate symport protein